MTFSYFFLDKKVTTIPIAIGTRRVEAEFSALWRFPQATRRPTLKNLHGPLCSISHA